MRRNILFVLAVLTICGLMLGCDEAAKEAAEKACTDLTGAKCIFDEGETGVDTPKNWYFLAGFELTETQAMAFDQKFELPLDILETVGIDTGKIDQMVAFAKVESLEGYGNRLRYANKLIVQDKKLMLDTEAMDKLGESIGSSGAGTYVAYYAGKPNGFISGDVKDCDGNGVADILATASDGPFFTRTVDGGSYALPTLTGKPAQINFSLGEDCAGSTSDPSTDTGEDTNPKTEDNPDLDETPPSDNFSDGTDNVNPPETDMEDSGGDGAVSGDCIDLTVGTWSFGSGCWAQGFGNSSDAYADLFPGGTYDSYMYVSSSGSGNSSCTLTTTVSVPSGMTQLEVGYNFASQEYEEWVGSAYNDIFTVIIQGAPDYSVNRTVNNIATDNDWQNIPTAAETIADIASSDDATYNPTGAQYDGSLKSSDDANEDPRGNPADDNLGKVSVVTLPDGMTTITVIVTVSDVGDAIYDSVGLIDHMCFK
jgi:hypothetical protein